MAINPELARKLIDPTLRDAAQLETLRYLLAQPGISTDEIVTIDVLAPYLNDIPEAGITELLSRIIIANKILPIVRDEIGLQLRAIRFPDQEIIGDIFGGAINQLHGFENIRQACSICHMLLGQAEEIAELWSTPLRETYAAIAHASLQMQIHFLLTNADPEVKKFTKTHLLYFGSLEMLAIGIKTSAYQYGFVKPGEEKADFFVRPEIISPVSILRGGTEDKFKAALVLGQVDLDGHVNPLPGLDFFYLT